MSFSLQLGDRTFLPMQQLTIRNKTTQQIAKLLPGKHDLADNMQRLGANALFSPV